MSPDGFHLEGFLRALQNELFTTLSILALILVIYFIAKFAIGLYEGSNEISVDEAKTFRKSFKVGAVVLAIATIGFTVIHAASFAVSSRLPRSDTDKSQVYDQMKSNQR